MSETVLLYNLSGTEAGRRLKPVLLKMRIRIRIVEPESYQLPIETLIGGKGAAGAENAPKAGMSTAIPEPMLVMEGFSERRLDQLLAEMRRHSGTSIPERCGCRKTSSLTIPLACLHTLYLSYRGPMDFRSIGTVVG